MRRIEIGENGINLVIGIDDAGIAELLLFSAAVYDGRRAGGRTSGGALSFADFRDSLDQKGRLITLVRKDGSGAETAVKFRFFNGISAAEISADAGLHEVFGEIAGAYIGKDTSAGALRCAGGCPRWEPCSPTEVCLEDIRVGMLRDRTKDAFLVWQREKRSIIAAVGLGEDGFAVAVGELTLCRRAIRGRIRDCLNLPVVYDGEDAYMLSHISAAAECGCNYFLLGSDSVREIAARVRDTGMTPGLRAESLADENAGDILRECRAKLLYGNADFGELISQQKDMVLARAGTEPPPAETGALWSVSGGAASAMLALPPEQVLVRCAVSPDDTREIVAATLMEGMLCRIMLRGRLDSLGSDSLAAVKEGIAVYKRIRTDIRDGLPLPAPDGISPAILCADRKKCYIALRKRPGGRTAVLSTPTSPLSAKCIYPSFFSGTLSCTPETLSVTFSPADTCALLEVLLG